MLATVRLFRILSLGIAMLALSAGGHLSAQARPSAAQAEQLLRSRPELVSQLQSRIAGSGLTPDQIRARLRAEGYPEGLLDAYLNQRGGDVAAPTDDVFSAVRALTTRTSRN